MIIRSEPRTCHGCHGIGVQRDKDGLFVLCPICAGSGTALISTGPKLPPGSIVYQV